MFNVKVKPQMEYEYLNTESMSEDEYQPVSMTAPTGEIYVGLVPRSPRDTPRRRKKKANNPYKLTYELIIKHGVRPHIVSIYTTSLATHESCIQINGRSVDLATMWFRKNSDMYDTIQELIRSESIIGLGVLNDKLQEMNHWISPLFAQWWADATNIEGIPVPRQSKKKPGLSMF